VVITPLLINNWPGNPQVLEKEREKGIEKGIEKGEGEGGDERDFKRMENPRGDLRERGREAGTALALDNIWRQITS
jgi:hypothetical protein